MFRPTQFGKYYLTERIAVGGMAELFKAKMFGVGGFEKPMVVKQILPKYAKNADFIKMFIDEAKIAVTLSHGNIVPIYELGRIDGIYFIAMEYVNGKDLADILESARAQSLPLSVEHAAFVGIEICKGLDYAHRRTAPDGQSLRVVHRDISPPNILISMEGEIKIADFGIAKAAHKLGSTEAGVVKGTFGYMSPEQVRGLPVDFKTDIFSAGILIHEMLTGRRLFTGESEFDAIERVKVAKIPAPSSVNPRVPAAMDPIIFKALARDPADRYADANELQLALSRFLFTSATGASASTLSRYMHELFDGQERAKPDQEISSLFPREFSASEVTLKDRPGNVTRPNSEDSQVFAVRSNLDSVESRFDASAVSKSPFSPVSEPGGSGSARQVMDVGAGASAGVNATLALPSLEAPQGARGEFEDEATSVFQGQRAIPERPTVPELRFPPKAKPGRTSTPAPTPKPGSAADSSLSELPSTAELAALADLLDETSSPRPAPSRPTSTPSAKPPARELTPKPTPRPPAPASIAPAEAARSLTPEELLEGTSRPSLITRGATVDFDPTVPDAAGEPRGGRSTGDSGLMSMLVQTGSVAAMGESEGGADIESDEAGDNGQPPEHSRSGSSPQLSLTPRALAAAASRQTGSRKKPVSGVVSATMRLFVQGLEEDAEPAPVAMGETKYDPDVTEDLVPRTVKPTVLGWIIILLVVLGAGAVVIYKKTDWFHRESTDDSSEVLRPEDIRKEVAEAPKTGTVALDSKPEGALFFRFVGETPVTIPRLDQGLSYLVRVEREGYQPVYKVIGVKDFGNDKARTSVTLSPAGAAVSEDLPTLESGAASGRVGTLEVASDPPAAMVWLLVGRAPVEIRDLDTGKSHNFKAITPGRQQVLVNVAPVDFEKGNGAYSSTVNLEEEQAGVKPTEAGAAPGAKTARDAGAATPEGEEKGSRPAAEPAPRPKETPKVTTQSQVAKPTTVKSNRPKRGEGKRPAKKKKPIGPKIPDWAR